MNPQPKVKYWRSKPYLKYLSYQPSCISGAMDYDEVACEMRTIYHHHSKDSGKGMALKVSDVWAIPVTNNEHRLIEDGELNIKTDWVVDVCFTNLDLYLKVSKRILGRFPQTREGLIELSDWLCQEKIK